MKTKDDIKLIRSLTNLHHDLSHMKEDDNYNIFDDWEIEELNHLVEKLIEHFREKP